jgi:acyl-CoA dehydrogenase
MPGCWRAPDGPGAQPDIGVAVRDHHRCGSDGSHYVLNGLKTFISNGSHCDLLIATKADLSAGAAGISQAGRVRARTSSGEDRQHGQETYELFFSGMEQLACQRLIIAALCASVAESAVLEVIRYTKHREAFGRPLIEFPHNRFELAQLKAETLSSKSRVDHCIQ